MKIDRSARVQHRDAGRFSACGPLHLKSGDRHWHSHAATLLGPDRDTLAPASMAERAEVDVCGRMFKAQGLNPKTIDREGREIRG